MTHTFILSSEYIELNKLLKLHGVGDSGGQIKQLISDGAIFVNGNQEFRIRNKLIGGEVVTYPEEDITITVQKTD